MGENFRDCSDQQKSIVKNGRAGFNSVMYSSNDYKVIATRNKKGGIDIKVTPVKQSILEKLSLFFDRLPIIRGIWLLIEGFVIAWKLSIVIFLLFIFNLFLLLQVKNTEELGTIYTGVISDYGINYMLIFGVLLICAILNKFTQLGKFHSAEHMVDNAYVASRNLNLSNVLKYSRVHQNCGSILMVFILLLYILFLLITNDLILSLFLSYVLGYEVYMIKNPIINFLLKPFYLLGCLIQYHLFTTVPEKKHLEVAVAAYETLLKKP